MITGKQRSELKRIAQDIRPTVMIGKEEVTPAVMDAIEDYLAAHELVKVQIQDGAILDPKETANEIAEACRNMSESKTGALIVMPRKDSLNHIIETGDTMDAKVSRRLIMNIFFKNSPLHDGAMIIEGDRITAARCTLPITQRTDIPPSLGMRHKAAIGISEETDADVVVVSEETGGVSFVRGGKLTSIGNINELKLILGSKEEAK